MPGTFTPSQVADFRIYEALLRKWQKTINIVATSTLEDLWTRHFADSAQLVCLAPEATSWVDLGSGGGFPGMVIAILLKERLGARIDLVESDTRKAAFLRTVSRETGVAVQVHNGRVEAVLPTLPLPEIITARALAPLPKLLDWAGEKIAQGAIGLFPKGQDVDAELNASANYSRLHLEKLPSRTDSRSSIVKVTRA
jgi:16S rRNA (guanine527-N7)-methyltransferase